MCFDPEYLDKYKRFKKEASETRSFWFGLWWRIFPIAVAFINIPAGVLRSPILLPYGFLGYSALLAVLCEVRVAAKRRSMLG